MVLRVNLWSGPRNVSTALMYAFAQRADTRVVDEPLYAAWLAASGVPHPGRADVLRELDPDGERVVRETVLGPSERPVLFLKQMAHHLRGLEGDLAAPAVRRLLEESEHVLLVREPAEVLASLIANVPRPELGDTGLDVQVQLLEELRAQGRDPAVLDARLLLQDPPAVLERLCAHLGIDWDSAMLRWDAGGRPEDGPWAPHWYAKLHESTGFAPWRPRDTRLPEPLVPVLESCRERYAVLEQEARRFLAA